METVRTAPAPCPLRAHTPWWSRPSSVLGMPGGATRPSLAGRSRSPTPPPRPPDRYIVASGQAAAALWWSDLTRTLSPAQFGALHDRMLAHAADRPLSVQDVYVGTDADLRLPVRIVTDTDAHRVFARMAYVVPGAAEGRTFQPEFTLLDLATFHADPGRDGTHGDAFVALQFGQRLGLIGGAVDSTALRQAVLTVMHDRLPRRGVLSLQAAATVGAAGDVAVFLGPPGSGKTALCADPARRVIADDELGWSDHGISDLAGGAHARFVRLNRTAPRIRAAGHPAAIVLLAADPCGVLPAVSLLTPQQAMYHFICGYGAPRQADDPPADDWSAWFSPCGGAPLLARRPGAYAHLLGDHLARHETRLYLINTGWLGGPSGHRQRVPLEVSRTLTRAALAGTLDTLPTRHDRVFGVHVPRHVPGVPDDLLDPPALWPSAQAHDAQARDVARHFREQFRASAGDVAPAVRAAAPITEPPRA